MAQPVNKEDVKNFLKMANHEENIPGNLTMTEMIKMHKFVAKGEDDKARKLWINALVNKTSNRKDTFQPVRKLSFQLTTEKAAFKAASEDTPAVLMECMMTWLKMVGDFTRALYKEQDDDDMTMESISDTDDEHDEMEEEMKKDVKALSA